MGFGRRGVCALRCAAETNSRVVCAIGTPSWSPATSAEGSQGAAWLKELPIRIHARQPLMRRRAKWGRRALVRFVDETGRRGRRNNRFTRVEVPRLPPTCLRMENPRRLRRSALAHRTVTYWSSFGVVPASSCVRTADVLHTSAHAIPLSKAGQVSGTTTHNSLRSPPTVHHHPPAPTPDLEGGAPDAGWRGHRVHCYFAEPVFSIGASILPSLGSVAQAVAGSGPWSQVAHLAISMR